MLLSLTIVLSMMTDEEGKGERLSERVREKCDHVCRGEGTGSYRVC